MWRKYNSGPLRALWKVPRVNNQKTQQHCGQEVFLPFQTGAKWNLMWFLPSRIWHVTPTWSFAGWCQCTPRTFSLPSSFIYLTNICEVFTISDSKLVSRLWQWLSQAQFLLSQDSHLCVLGTLNGWSAITIECIKDSDKEAGNDFQIMKEINGPTLGENAWGN